MEQLFFFKLSLFIPKIANSDLFYPTRIRLFESLFRNVVNFYSIAYRILLQGQVRIRYFLVQIQPKKKVSDPALFGPDPAQKKNRILPQHYKNIF